MGWQQGFHWGLPWTTIARRTFAAVMTDDCLALAAQLGFYFFLALWPGLIFLVALASFFPVSGLERELTDLLEPIAPSAVIDLIATQLARISESRDFGLMTFGGLGALWSSSLAIRSLVTALNRAFDRVETRAWWRIRLIAVVLTLFLLVFGLSSLAFIMLGPGITETVADWINLRPAVVMAWRLIWWPAIVCLIITAVSVVYWAAPNTRSRWHWFTPGAVLAALVWILSSLGLRAYLANFDSYVETYGAIGGVMILMIWLYLVGLALVLGAELDAEIGHVSAEATEGPR